MPTHGLSESLTCQQVCPQNRLGEHLADFAGNCECYKKDRNPKTVYPTQTGKFYRMTCIHENYRTRCWKWGMNAIGPAKCNQPVC